MRSHLSSTAVLLYCFLEISSAFLVSHGTLEFQFRKRKVVVQKRTTFPDSLILPGGRPTNDQSSQTFTMTQLWDGQWWDNSRSRGGRRKSSADGGTTGRGNGGIEADMYMDFEARSSTSRTTSATHRNQQHPQQHRFDSHIRDAYYEYADVVVPVAVDERNKDNLFHSATTATTPHDYYADDMLLAAPPVLPEHQYYGGPSSTTTTNILAPFSSTSSSSSTTNTVLSRLLQSGTKNGNGEQIKTFSFQYKSTPYTISLNFDAALRHEYRTTAQRQYLYDSSHTPHPPDNWQEEFYRMFLSHPDDGPIVEQLLEQLIHVTNANDHDTLLEVAVAFVQGSISYNWDTYHRIEHSSTLYPYETLYDQTGVCSDKSILLARLLVELGYDCVFFAFDHANHIALGVRVPVGMDNYHSGYAFCETTSYGPIGRIPSKLVGNIQLDNEMPSLHRITHGGRVYTRIVQNKQMEQEDEAKYGTEYFFLGSEQKQLKQDMVVLEEEILYLNDAMNGCQSRTDLTPEQFDECQALVDEHNRRVELYNAMVALFNTLNNNANNGIRSSSFKKRP